MTKWWLTPNDPRRRCFPVWWTWGLYVLGETLLHWGQVISQYGLTIRTRGLYASIRYR